ncbi:MAG: PBP1A family penicillin-binding protein [Candidatus Eisenbacteria bacterium]|nr:PBP1A family penicillin-binding protein [Candidatus Eisenbacteria bacterium]
MKSFAIALLVTPLLLAAALYALFLIFGQDLPSPRTLREVEPSVATRVFDADGELIDELYVEDRVPMRLDQVPRHFLDAIIASEDRQFYSHWGLNPVSMLRAIGVDLAQGRIAQGASTITQQLARNLFLHHQRTWIRKIREAILALRIERSFGKDEILELYVNQIYFGEGAYGVHAASRRYFGVAPNDLTLAQCALLAALPKNPARFSPRRYPETARARRNLVLRAMQDHGVIDAATYRRAAAQPLGVHGPHSSDRPGAYFSEMVRQELAERYGTSAVYHEGLRIATTLDLDLQRAAEASLEGHLQRLEEMHRYPQTPEELAARLAELELDSAVELPVPLQLQGAVVAIEPSSGAIRALVGGRDFGQSEWNRAVQAPRQAASAFKPFIYAEALRQGFRPTDFLLDAPVEFDIVGARDSVWKTHNFSETYHGPVTLAYALAKSINVPTARLLHEIGVEPVVELAHAMGLQRPLPPVLSLAAGSGEVTLLEMTAAYGVLANQGIRVTPHSIARVLDRRGHPLEVHQPESRQVLDARTSFIATSMMQAVMSVGTGRTARSIYGFTAPAAGKTGTSDDYADAWFVGFTPDLAVGVWVGFDVKIPIGGRHTGTGAAAALPIWAAVMQASLEIYGVRDFAVPEGVERVRVCLASGELATDSCEEVFDLAFLPGTAPTQTCRLHRPGAQPADDFRDLDRRRKPRDPWARSR